MIDILNNDLTFNKLNNDTKARNINSEIEIKFPICLYKNKFEKYCSDLLKILTNERKIIELIVRKERSAVKDVTDIERNNFRDICKPERVLYWETIDNTLHNKLLSLDGLIQNKWHSINNEIAKLEMFDGLEMITFINIILQKGRKYYDEIIVIERSFANEIIKKEQDYSDGILGLSSSKGIKFIIKLDTERNDYLSILFSNRVNANNYIIEERTKSNKLIKEEFTITNEIGKLLSIIDDWKLLRKTINFKGIIFLYQSRKIKHKSSIHQC